MKRRKKKQKTKDLLFSQWKRFHLGVEKEHVNQIILVKEK